MPWSDVALVRFAAAGPVGWVQIVRHGGATLLARGLVDQPLLRTGRRGGRPGTPAYAANEAAVVGPTRTALDTIDLR